MAMANVAERKRSRRAAKRRKRERARGARREEEPGGPRWRVLKRASVLPLETLRSFVELLDRRCGIAVASGSPIDRALAFFEWLRKVHEEEVHAESIANLERIHEALGIHALCSRVMRLDSDLFLESALAHLHLLATTRSPGAQNVPTLSSHSATRKLFELLIGALAFGLTGRIELEDPNASGGGKNPDVLCEFGGESWGLACKTLNSTHPQTLLDTIEKGARQIAAAGVDHGFVVVNPVTIVPHDEFFREHHELVGALVPRVFESGHQADDLVRNFSGDLIERANVQAAGLWDEIIAGPCGGYIFYWETLVNVSRGAGNAWQQVVGLFPVADDPPHPAAVRFFRGLNRQLGRA